MTLDTGSHSAVQNDETDNIQSLDNFAGSDSDSERFLDNSAGSDTIKAYEIADEAVSQSRKLTIVSLCNAG